MSKSEVVYIVEYEDFEAATLLSIDPGCEFGWALWDHKNVEQPLACGICSGESKQWDKRLDESIRAFDNQLGAYICTYDIEKVVIELPSFFDNAGGRAVAAQGDLVKLAVATGSIRQYVRENFTEIKKIDWAPVTQWKGQMSKMIVNDRIERHFKHTGWLKRIKSHMWDAIGIGLWARGKFE